MGWHQTVRIILIKIRKPTAVIICQKEESSNKKENCLLQGQFILHFFPVKLVHLVVSSRRMLGIQMKGQQRVQKRPKAISEKVERNFSKIEKGRCIKYFRNFIFSSAHNACLLLFTFCFTTINGLCG